MKEIDQLLIKIKPPSEFHRSPRPIETTLKVLESKQVSSMASVLFLKSNSALKALSFV